MTISFLEVPNGWKLSAVDKIAKSEKGSIVSGPFGSNISKKFFRKGSMEETVRTLRR